MVDQVLSARYRVVRHVARGGMAEVYLAHDELLDRPVAVKVLFPELAEDGSFVERFRREARAAAGLNHPNIVSVFDFGEDDGSYYIVMEYVDGTTLRDVIRSGGPLEPARAAEVGADVAAALSVAHQHGIIHRDVKPGNVLISSATDAVKVADFGIARAGDPRESLTMTGAVMGTATYLSPEQAQGHPIDHRADIYALGIVLYEMLAGRPPFSGDTPMAIAYKHLSESPVPPSTHNSAVPAALDRVVLRAMDKDPDARYASANELRAALLTAGNGGAAAEPTVVAAPVVAAGATQMLPPVTEATTALGPDRAPVATPPPGDVARRRRLAVASVLLLLLLIFVVAILLTRDRGGTATVPSVVGLTVDDARARLDGVNLRSAVEEANRPGAPNQVLEQRPPANEKVDRTTTVTLVVAASTTTVPPTARTTPTTRRSPPTTEEPPATTSPPPATTAPPVTDPPRTNPPQTTTPRITFPRRPATTVG